MVEEIGYRKNRHLLVVAKPEAHELGLEEMIVSELQRLGLRLVASKEVDFFGRLGLAEALYAGIKDKPYFRIPVLAIQLGTVTVMVFEGEVDLGKIEKWRGPTRYDEIMKSVDTRASFRGRMYLAHGRHGAGILKDVANFVHMGEDPDYEIPLFFSKEEVPIS